MSSEMFLKLVALDIDALEARVIDERNVKDLQQACDYLYPKSVNNEIWIILPCTTIK